MTEYDPSRPGLSVYREKGLNMKRLILVLVGVAAVQFFVAQTVDAFPGERIANRAAHFGQRVAYKIDHHVVHPVTHGVARRLR